jgi:hypothetical protein
MRGPRPPIHTYQFEDRHSSLGGEHGERIALVKDRFATAFGGASKMRP